MINWPVGVNQRIKRDSNGHGSSGVVIDKTRCGKKQSRPSEQLNPDTYAISMMFRKNEFVTFKNWFKTSLRRGALTFAFPDIFTKQSNTEYRIVDGYDWENPSADIFIVTMEWEEV